MTRISQSTIEAVFNTMDIYDTVSEFVSLTKKGVNYTGCCPFHDEKTPSFSVSASKQIFKCFGCGKGGNAIQFLMEKNMSYPEAIKHLANKFNVSITYDESSKEKEEENEKLEQAEKVLIAAERKYIEFINSENGNDAKNYLINSRGYDRETIIDWRLGFAPKGNVIRKIASEKGIISACVDAGIINTKDGNTYDVQQGRIIFPIHNHLGKLVGFGGRILDENDAKTYAKYLNTKETILYNKSAVIYGLYKSAKAIKENGFAILVEGYTDVISFHKANADMTVATCGTALTDAHAKLLKRFTDHVIIARDGDTAGKRAIIRDIEVLLKYGFKVEVLPLTDGEDPDNLAKKYFITPKEETAADETN